MTTLGALKADIATDLGRSDLTNEIATAITDAIRHYKTEKFWFCENRSATFATVAAQSSYTSSDDADIPLFFSVNAVTLEDGTEEFTLDWVSQVKMELDLGNTAASGRPYNYSYFNETFYLYPVPDAAYTVRPIGALEVDAPATDAEADNPWMTEARELIRCKAKKLLYAHTIKDQALAAVQGAAEEQALINLWRKTSRKRSQGKLKATRF